MVLSVSVQLHRQDTANDQDRSDDAAQFDRAAGKAKQPEMVHRQSHCHLPGNDGGDEGGGSKAWRQHHGGDDIGDPDGAAFRLCPLPREMCSGLD